MIGSRLWEPNQSGARNWIRKSTPPQRGRLPISPTAFFPLPAKASHSAQTGVCNLNR